MQKSISNFKENEEIIVLKINCEEEFSRRLRDLGLFEGSKIKIIKNDNSGPIIIQILNSKIALSRVEAEKIYGK